MASGLPVPMLVILMGVLGGTLAHGNYWFICGTSALELNSRIMNQPQFYLLNSIIQKSWKPIARILRFWGFATLTSLLLIVLAQVHIAPVQSQIISLPESWQAQPRGDTTQVGNLDVGKIRLDGKVLFQVAAPTSAASSAASASSTSSSLIELRVKEIQFQLSNLIRDGFDPDTLKITPSVLDKQTVIVASDKDWGPRQLLTVTRLDAQLKGPGTIDEVAQIWSKRIEQALLQAWEQRQPTYQKQQIPVVLFTLAAMVAGSFGIRMLQMLRGSIRQMLAQQQRERERTESNPSEPIPFPTSGDETSSQPAPKQPRLGMGRYLPQLTLDQQLSINLIVRQVFVGYSGCHLVWWTGDYLASVSPNPCFGGLVAASSSCLPCYSLGDDGVKVSYRCFTAVLCKSNRQSDDRKGWWGCSTATPHPVNFVCPARINWVFSGSGWFLPVLLCHRATSNCPDSTGGDRLFVSKCTPRCRLNLLHSR